MIRVSRQGCFKVLRRGVRIREPEPEGQTSGENCRMPGRDAGGPRDFETALVSRGCGGNDLTLGWMS